MVMLKRFYSSFHQRGGFHIFFSTISLRIIQFILGVLIIRLLDIQVYGNLSYAFTIIQLIIPFSGAGLYLSLLHFGSIQDEFDKKIKLFNFSIRQGFLFSILIIVAILALSGFISGKMPGSVSYLKLFSIYILSYYIFYTSISLLRVLKKNKEYAAVLLLNAILVFVLSLLGVLIAQGTGYILGFSIAPTITAVFVLLILRKKIKIHYQPFKKVKDIPVDQKAYLNYGIFAGLGNIASQMAWQLDTIMIGIILAQSTLVATYKVAALIPFSLVFIPSVFMQTDFVYIAEKYKDKKYLIKYYKKYLKVFVLIVFIILSVWYIFGGEIIALFGDKYNDTRPLINILMINIVFTFLLRVPLGNILSAVGKAKWNSYSAISMLFFNLLLNFILIPKYGIFGAAYATVISIGTSSFVALILFNIYVRKLSMVEN